MGVFFPVEAVRFIVHRLREFQHVGQLLFQGVPVAAGTFGNDGGLFNLVFIDEVLDVFNFLAFDFAEVNKVFFPRSSTRTR
jgi:hypothetical protein